MVIPPESFVKRDQGHKITLFQRTHFSGFCQTYFALAGRKIA